MLYLLRPLAIVVAFITGGSFFPPTALGGRITRIFASVCRGHLVRSLIVAASNLRRCGIFLPLLSLFASFLFLCCTFFLSKRWTRFFFFWRGTVKENVRKKRRG